jgi:hypothetical protein
LVPTLDVVENMTQMPTAAGSSGKQRELALGGESAADGEDG